MIKTENNQKEIFFTRKYLIRTKDLKEYNLEKKRFVFVLNIPHPLWSIYTVNKFFLQSVISIYDVSNKNSQW